MLLLDVPIRGEHKLYTQNSLFQSPLAFIYPSPNPCVAMTCCFALANLVKGIHAGFVMNGATWKRYDDVFPQKIQDSICSSPCCIRRAFVKSISAVFFLFISPPCAIILILQTISSTIENIESTKMKFNVCVLIAAGFTLFSLAATTLHKTLIYSGPDKLSIALLMEAISTLSTSVWRVSISALWIF